MELEKMKNEALKRLNWFISKGVIPNVKNDFLNGDIGLFERQNKVFNATYYWLSNYKEIEEKIKEISETYDFLPYMIQLTHTTFGDCYSIFFVSKYEEEWDYDWDNLKQGYSFVYVYNKDDDMCSEFGDIKFEISKNMGGIVRVG